MFIATEIRLDIPESDFLVNAAENLQRCEQERSPLRRGRHNPQVALAHMMFPNARRTDQIESSSYGQSIPTNGESLNFMQVNICLPSTHPLVLFSIDLPCQIT